MVLEIDWCELAGGKRAAAAGDSDGGRSPGRKSASCSWRLHGRTLARYVRASGIAVTKPIDVVSTHHASGSERSYSIVALFFGVLAIAGGYASAFLPGGAPVWGVWLLAI